MQTRVPINDYSTDGGGDGDDPDSPISPSFVNMGTINDFPPCGKVNATIFQQDSNLRTTEHSNYASKHSANHFVHAPDPILETEENVSHETKDEIIEENKLSEKRDTLENDDEPGNTNDPSPYGRIQEPLRYVPYVIHLPTKSPQEYPWYSDPSPKENHVASLPVLYERKKCVATTTVPSTVSINIATAPGEDQYGYNDENEDSQKCCSDARRSRPFQATLFFLLIALAAIIGLVIHFTKVKDPQSYTSSKLEDTAYQTISKIPTPLTSINPPPQPSSKPTSELSIVPYETEIESLQFSTTTTRINDIQSALITENVSKEEDLANVESAQSRALQWLAKQDEKRISVGEMSKLVQLYSLVVLYYSTGGDVSWKRQYNFLSSQHECGWKSDSNDTKINGIEQCNASKEPTVIALWADGLSGTIPTEIGHLTSLNKLYLYQNKLTGKIPTDIGRLTSLTELHLDQNELSETIPSEIGYLNSLTLLELDQNKLSGTIPSEIGHLIRLKESYLYQNELTGSIPSEIGKLTNMNTLSLSRNKLSANIPTSIGELLELSDLYLYKNHLAGSIPTSLGNLAKLMFLYIDENDLSGTLPSKLCETENIEIWADVDEITCSCCRSE